MSTLKLRNDNKDAVKTRIVQFSPPALIEGRKLKGLTQADLAKLLGKSKGAVANWETGRCRPGATNLRKIAEITQQPVDLLIKGPKGDSYVDLKSNRETPASQLENYLRALPKRLVLCREQREMSRRDLSLKLAKSVSAVGNWETGRSCPSPANLRSLAGALECSITYLVTGESAESEHPPQVPQTRADCERHVEEFLDSCGGDERRLCWTLIELQAHFPLSKWRPRSEAGAGGLGNSKESGTVP